MKIILFFWTFYILYEVVLGKNENSCSDVPYMKNLDIKKFTSSIWYEVGRSVNSFEKNYGCGTLSMIPSTKNKIYVTVSWANKESAKMDGKQGAVTYSNSEAGLWSLRASNAQTPPQEYRIINTDYISYAVIYSCYAESQSKDERWWILGRTDKLTSETYKKVSEALNQINVNMRSLVFDSNCDGPEAPAPTLPTNREPQCYQPKMADNFNMTKFSMRAWFEIKRYENTFEDEEKCTKVMHFLKNDKEFLVVYTMTGKDGKKNNVPNHGSIGEGKWPFLVKFDQSEKFESPYVIVGTDYSTYSVIYHCYEDVSTLINKTERLWILSGTPQISDEVNKLVQKVIADSGINVEQTFVTTDQSCYESATAVPSSTTLGYDSTTQATAHSDSDLTTEGVEVVKYVYDFQLDPSLLD